MPLRHPPRTIQVDRNWKLAPLMYIKPLLAYQSRLLSRAAWTRDRFARSIIREMESGENAIRHYSSLPSPDLSQTQGRFQMVQRSVLCRMQSFPPEYRGRAWVPFYHKWLQRIQISHRTLNVSYAHTPRDLLLCVAYTSVLWRGKESRENLLIKSDGVG